MVESDHNTEILDLSLKFEGKVEPKVEMYNLHDKKCQQVFHDVTSKNDELNDCLDNDKHTEEKVDDWKKVLESCYKQSFKKIGIGKGK